MQIKLIEETENPLMDRKKIRFEVDHTGAPTPSRAEVLKELSSELGISEDSVVIEKVATLHGRQVASGLARIYESEEAMVKFESGHLSERTEVSKEKMGEEITEEEPETEEEAEGPEETEEEEAEEEPEPEVEEEEEVTTEEEEVEETEEQEAEEETEEEEAEEAPEEEAEEIDYQEISDLTISEIKDKSEEMDFDYEALLEAEKENKDRKTLKEWIESKLSK